MSSLMPPEKRKQSSSDSPMQISAPVRALDDVIEALAQRGARRDHLQSPDEPGLLTVFKLCDFIPGIRHDGQFYAIAGFCAFGLICSALGSAQAALQGPDELRIGPRLAAAPAPTAARAAQGLPQRRRVARVRRTRVEPELARPRPAGARGGPRGAARRSGRARRRPPAACSPPQRDALGGGRERQRDRRGRPPARRPARRRRPTRRRRSSRAQSPPWRASTASTSASRLRSTPLATRRGGTSSVGATSACTSTSSGREPSIAQSTTEPGRARGLGDEARGGVLHLDQPASRISKTPDLVGGAEAVLERPQRAVGALALALELQHAVHQVLEHARARERALLGHVAHQHRRRCRAPWPRRISRPATSRTWPTEPGAPVSAGSYSTCTESTTHTSGRSASIVASTASRSVSATIGTPGRAGRAAPRAASPARPTPRRTRRAPCGRRRRGCRARARGERGLADAGRAAEQHQRAGHEAAAEHAVELADAGRQPRDRRRLDVARAPPGVSARPAERARVPAPRGRRARRAPPRPSCSTRRSPGSARATWGSRGRRRSRRRRWRTGPSHRG